MDLTKQPLKKAKSFFDYDSYVIDEKVSGLSNAYNVLGSDGKSIGAVVQKASAMDKILGLFIKNAMLPFHLEIRDSDGQVQATLSKGWTFFMPEVSIVDSKNQTVGKIKQKVKLFAVGFSIFGGGGAKIAEIRGNWRAWDFKITDQGGAQIGTISKQWNGMMKELFTTADKYNVQVTRGKIDSGALISILASAIAIDMLLKSN